MMEDKIDIAKFVKPEPKKKGKEKKSINSLELVIPVLLFTLVVILGAWGLESWHKWRMTNQPQFPLEWKGFVRKIVPDVISPISGLPISEEERIMNDYPLAPLIKTIYVLESTEGKNDGCKGKGKFNGFGYAQSDHTWACFDSFDEVVKSVNNWFKDRLSTNGNDVVEAICHYNLGIPNQNTCVYAENFMSVIIKKQ